MQPPVFLAQILQEEAARLATRAEELQQLAAQPEPAIGADLAAYRDRMDQVRRDQDRLTVLRARLDHANHELAELLQSRDVALQRAAGIAEAVAQEAERLAGITDHLVFQVAQHTKARHARLVAELIDRKRREP